MDVIGKSVNFIKLHDLLDRMEVEKIYSTLHVFYNTILKTADDQGVMEWQGKEFTKESLKNALEEEEGVITSICLKEHNVGRCEVIIDFKSGNQYVAQLSNQEQYAEILEYLVSLYQEE